MVRNLYSAVFRRDGSLWRGCDEGITVERLSLVEPYIFGKHQLFSMADFVELFNHEDEIDVEGMDYENNYLWLTGSHSKKRKKTKRKNPQKDLERLATIKAEPNRYLLARIPVVNGELLKSCSLPDHPLQKLTATCKKKQNTRIS